PSGRHRRTAPSTAPASRRGGVRDAPCGTWSSSASASGISSLGTRLGRARLGRGLLRLWLLRSLGCGLLRRLLDGRLDDWGLAHRSLLRAPPLHRRIPLRPCPAAPHPP